MVFLTMLSCIYSCNEVCQKEKDHIFLLKKQELAPKGKTPSTANDLPSHTKLPDSKAPKKESKPGKSLADPNGIPGKYIAIFHKPIVIEYGTHIRILYEQLHNKGGGLFNKTSTWISAQGRNVNLSIIFKKSLISKNKFRLLEEKVTEENLRDITYFFNQEDNSRDLVFVWKTVPFFKLKLMNPVWKVHNPVS